MANEDKDSYDKRGRWSDVFNIPNVAVHASLLPSGKILHWGRREHPERDPQSKDPNVACLDEHFTKSFLFTPFSEGPVNGKYGESEPIAHENQPMYWNERKEEETSVNLFCSGHTLLPSGNLLVCGGHWSDGFGVEQSTIFDYKQKKWIQLPLMNKGRWYPSVMTLPDGRVLTISGSDNTDMDPTINSIPQILTLKDGGAVSAASTAPASVWTEVIDPIPPGLMLDLFPRIHVDPVTGNPVMVGSKAATWILELKDEDGKEIKDDQGVVGRWKQAGTERSEGFRDYASSVMYASGKIMFIGGGTGDDAASSKVTEFLDLNKRPLKWNTKTIEMNHPRKQLNATVLPDGTVLATGGTAGPKFNDLSPRHVVKQSELFDPVAGKWRKMAKESVSRCYHATALLLPDARVFSAGGGEYGGCVTAECHTTAQIFEPPYLFQGTRPKIEQCLPDIEYGQQFNLTVGPTDKITTISLVRLGSVTHCRNMSQQLVFLEEIKQEGSIVTTRAPANPKIAPPGPYMLFVLNFDGVPSVAAMVTVLPLPVAAPAGFVARVADAAQQVLGQVSAQFSTMEVVETTSAAQVQPHTADHDAKIIDEQEQPHAVVGLTPLCPYGLGPCWGGAYDGLQNIKDIGIVRPVPSHTDCVAFVYLQDDTIPDIDVWRTEFEAVANKGYKMRGIEVTLHGKITQGKSVAHPLVLAGNATRPEVLLGAFQASSQLKWDIKESAPKPISDVEAAAYGELVRALKGNSEAKFEVTGTVQKLGDGEYSLDVREYKVI